jgi:hypothetical protein
LDCWISTHYVARGACKSDCGFEEERLEEDQYWENLKRERHLLNCVARRERQKNERREYDLNYISEEEIVESESEEEVEEEDFEEEEDDDLEEDELEDEF